MVGPDQEAPVITLQGLKDRIILPRKIAMPSGEILAHSWSEIVAKTDEDGTEHGRLTSLHKGKLFHSKITRGTAERRDPDRLPGAKIKASWGPGLFPHGLSSWRYITGMEDVLMIHGHPMPSSINHIRTTHHSEEDLEFFFGSGLWASFVVDRGGAHLLRRYSDRYEQSIEAAKIIAGSYRGKERVVEVIAELAEKLSPLGLQYFYTPQIDYAEPDLVVFTDARFLSPET
jgi:hypothetical protein